MIDAAAAPAHQARVQRIAADVRARAAARAEGRGGFASLGKAAVSHFVPDPHDPRHRDRKLDVRDLREVLALDPAARTCTAEPGVTFLDLVRRTLPHGLVPMLVPELKTITIGGAVSGCSVESMSHRHGGFHDTCLEYEVVSGTGEVLRCSRERDPELFERLHGSYGTLGILTALELRLVPAKPFVRLEHRRFATFAAFQEALLARARLREGARDHDFVDAIVHAPDCFVLCLGRFADAPPPGVRPSRYGLTPFYRSTRERDADWLATEDYFFRYDADCHWLARRVPGLETRAVRFLLGRFLLGSTNLLTWSKRLFPVLKLEKHPPVVVDLFIPACRLADFYEWYEREVGYLPLWVVPYLVEKPYKWIDPAFAAAMGDDLMIDCAIYGLRNDQPGKDFARMLEEKTRELGGVKTLISQNFYDEATFWTIYDREGYERVKRRVDPTNLFRGLYEKMLRRPEAAPAPAAAPASSQAPSPAHVPAPASSSGPARPMPAGKR